MGDNTSPKQHAIDALNNGDLDTSELMYRQLLADPKESADAFFGLGVIAMRRGRMDEAAGFLRACLSVAPRAARAYLLLGRIAQGNKANIEASQMYSKALELSPDLVEAQQRLHSLSAAANPNNVHTSVPQYADVRQPSAF